MKNTPLVCIGLFLAAHIVVPLVWGDLYPFTSAPMFRDSPQQYCDYHVFAPNGTEFPQEEWLVQRVYDGNPVGYGVGVQPPAVIEQEFGVVHEEEAVRKHFEGRMSELSSQPRPLIVEQQVFGPSDEGSIKLVQTYRWRIGWPPPQAGAH